MTDKSSGRKRRLGRGLESLITTPVEIPAGEDPQGAELTETKATAAPDTRIGQHQAIIPLRVDSISPNRSQPRADFDSASLEELATSIRAAGVMQPILVRPTEPGRFELIAGERRLRAAKLVPLDRIPAVVREVDDRVSAEWALIENLQREDLNPIERAEAFRDLVDSHDLSHADLAQRVGVSRASISNTVRLNDLSEQMKAQVRAGELSMGHAKVLLGVDDEDRRAELAGEAMRAGWSVRELERQVLGGRSTVPTKRTMQAASERSPQSSYLTSLEERLGEHLGTRVRIQSGRKQGSGKVTIEFYSLDQFDGLLERFGFDNDV